MQGSSRFHGQLGPVVGLVVACLLFPATSAAVPSRSGQAGLSPRLADLTEPALRSAPRARVARDLGLAPAGPGSLLRDDERVLTEVRFGGGAVAGLDDLRDAGAIPVSVARALQTVTAWISPPQLPAVAAVPRVEGVTEVLAPMASVSSCPAGVAVTEGDGHLRAAEARGALGVDGAGVTVGVLSDSFDQDSLAPTRHLQDVESGDLPGPANTCPGQTTPVSILEDFASSGVADEGRAMAQIVHDLAPGANLSFATAFTGMTAFAQNIENLATAGADVIVDDVTYFEEPFFQEGPVGVAVSNVTDEGVAYFSSAGNNNLISAGHDIASWEAPAFRDAGSCPAGAPPYATHCMDFDPGAGADATFGLEIAAGATLRVNLQWAQPWNGVTTDLDGYLLSPANVVLAASEGYNVTATQRPFEFFAWTNSTGSAATVRIAINRCDLVCDSTGAGDVGTPRLKMALMQNGGGVTESEYAESSGGDVVGPTIFGHNGAEDAISTGAIRFSSTSSPQPYSSRGPVTHYFGPTTGVAPAAPLIPPRTLAKPDLVATDCGVTTFFVPTGTPGLFRFCGTSAAAPHAAAVAALMRHENASLAPAEIRSALTSTAVPVGTFSPAAVGAGRIDALEALRAVEISEPPPPPEEEAEEGGGEASTPPPPPPPPPPPFTPSTAASDRDPPSTFVRRWKRRVVTSGNAVRLVFRFGSDEAGATFLCRVDRAPRSPCPARLARRFRLGPHILRVFARDAAGNVDPTPAVARFRVVRQT